MHTRVALLFSEGSLSEYLHDRLERVQTLVEQIPSDRFQVIGDDQVIGRVVSQLEVEPINLHESDMVVEREEAIIDAHDFPSDFALFPGERTERKGIRITVSLPFSGHTMLLKLRPGSYNMNPPRAKISASSDGGTIEIIVEAPPQKDDAYFKERIDTTLRQVREWINNQKSMILNYNDNELKRVAAAVVSSRRAILGKSDEVLTALGIPLKQKQGTPSLPIRLRQKPIPVLRSVVDKAGQPSLSITTDDYEKILSLIRHQCRTFEGTPSTFRTLEEEDLRSIILSALNAVFQGDATGETFRGKGKTDIRIEAESRAAFVAECKIWRGPKASCAAVDQLLGYLTWRDCKTALLFFNKNNKDFTAILKTLPDHIRKHPCYESGPDGFSDEGEWRIQLRSPSDRAHKISCQVMVFNLYWANKPS